MRRASILAGTAVLALTAFAPVAAADPQPNTHAPIQSCFGIASGQLASSEPGVTGEHTSSFDEPRLGIGNIVFRDALGIGIIFGSVGEAGSLLAAIDGNPATSCP